MKKKVAKILRDIAQRLSPECRLLFPEVRVDKRDIIKLGTRYPLTRREVEDICATKYGMTTHTTPIHVMRRECVNYLKDKIKKDLFIAVEKNDLIEYEIDENCISGYLYLKKNEQD